MTFKEIQQEYESKGLDYNQYFSIIQDQLPKNIASDKALEFIREQLMIVLLNYSETKPKTKGGRIGRFFAKLASILFGR